MIVWEADEEEEQIIERIGKTIKFLVDLTWKA